MARGCTSRVGAIHQIARAYTDVMELPQLHLYWDLEYNEHILLIFAT